jgi:hypothetical protein
VYEDRVCNRRDLGSGVSRMHGFAAVDDFIEFKPIRPTGLLVPMRAETLEVGDAGIRAG